MGMNLRSCCHKCKVSIMHFRNEEVATMVPFYSKHKDCMKENPLNIETKEDQYQEEEWMEVYPEDREIEGIKVEVNYL